MDPAILGLEGKVALVTGAGGAAGHIGKGCAIMLARAGCHVCVVDINPETGERTAKEIRALGAKAIFVKADVTDLAQIDAMIKTCIRELGSMEICVNNVGGQAGYGHMSQLEVTPKIFDEVVTQNFRATFFCQQAEAKSMIERRVKGAIVNLSSEGALRARFGNTIYTASKAAISKLTMDGAFEFGPHGIRVNAIAPSLFAPPGFEQRINLQEVIEGFPLRRLPRAEEAGGVAVLLASELSSYVTGVTIPVDAGDHITTAMGTARSAPWSGPTH